MLPGARAKDIVETALNEIGNLGTHDVVILNVGSNDVEGKDLGTVLKLINAVVQFNYGTNILLVDIPYRQDLKSFSLENQKIKDFNKKLKKITAAYKHVSFIETNFKRELFTRHGLHWNKRGKTQVVNLLCQRIRSITEKRTLLVLNLKWKEEVIPGVSPNSLNQGRQDLEVQHRDSRSSCRTSMRQKRVPVTRNADFLW
jgi:hypothetical protein